MKFTLAFESFICHPYTADREKLVSIQKMSGMNRCRNEDTRDKALRRYLESINLTMMDYKRIEGLANAEWYWDTKGWILIPAHQINGALVQSCHSAPAGCRFNPDQLRSLLKVSDFITDRKKADGVFERFVLPKDGKGNSLSNQRRLTRNEYISKFQAVGTIDFDKTDTNEKAVRGLLDYTGKYCGVGASRKMAYGRFIVI